MVVVGNHAHLVDFVRREVGRAVRCLNNEIDWAAEAVDDWSNKVDTSS
jgi:hypothetical protein